MMDIKKRYAHMLFYYFINLHRQLLQQQRLLFTKRQRKSLQDLKSRKKTDTMEQQSRINPVDGQASTEGTDTFPDDIEILNDESFLS